MTRISLYDPLREHWKFIIRFVGTLKDGPRRLALTRCEHGTCEVHSDGWNVLHMTHMVLMTGVKAWKRAVM